MQQPKVGIILINYKDYAERFLADCRDSLRALSYPKEKYAVYIVDNETSAQTQSYLTQQFPEAVVIPNTANAGWGAGNTLGAQRAFADGCDDVVLLNMDTYVAPDWLSELSRGAHSDARIGIAQAKIYLHPPDQNGEFRLNALGCAFHYLGFGYSIGNHERDTGQPSDVTDIAYASGSSMYVKRSTFQQTGYFESDFFMYHDDLELCLKARLARLRVVLVPDSHVYHKHEFMRSNRQLYYMERNRFLVLLYFYQWKTLALIAPMLLLMEAGQWLFAMVNGYAVTRFDVYRYFCSLKNFRYILTRRRHLQAGRLMKTDREFLNICTAVIAYQEVENALLRYVGNPLMRGYWWLVRKLLYW